MPIPVNGFTNPGYAVAETLQDILARKQAQKHQDLVDAIAQQRANTDEYESKLRADAYKQEQEAMADWRKTQARNEWLKGMDVGDSASPEDIEKYGAGNYFDKIEVPQPQVTTSEIMPDFASTDDGGMQHPPTPEELTKMAPQPEPHEPVYKMGFKGTPEQRDEQKARDLMGYYSGHPDEWDKLNDWQRMLMYRDIDPKGTLPASFFTSQHLGEMTPMYTIDEKGNVVNRGSFPKGTTFRNLPGAGSGGSGGYNDVPFFNQEDNSLYFADPRTHQVVPAIMPGTKPASPPPATPPVSGAAGATSSTPQPATVPNQAPAIKLSRTPAKTTPLFPQQLDSQYTKLRTDPSRGKRNQAPNMVPDMIVAAATTPKVKSVLQSIWNDVLKNPQTLYNNLSIDQIVANHARIDGLTDQEQGDLRAALFKFGVGINGGTAK